MTYPVPDALTLARLRALIAEDLRCAVDDGDLARRLALGERWDLVFSIAEGLAGRARDSPLPLRLSASSLASRSTRSFSIWPLCALTQCQEILWRDAASISSRQRSSLSTGCFAAVFQPRLCQPSTHFVIPSTTYLLSE